MTTWKDQQVLIVGGGIGGLTAALALAGQGIAAQVIEQAAAFKEIGAGIQLGPNVFRMFERLGLIEPISALAVFPNNLIMFDSITGDEVTRIPLDEAFRSKFHYPYALIHRADLHNVLLDQCRKSNLIKLDAAQTVYGRLSARSWSATASPSPPVTSPIARCCRPLKFRNGTAGATWSFGP